MDRKRPMAEANRLSQLLRVLPEPERFPVDVRNLAFELSSQRYKDAPITQIETFDIDGVEGLLGRHPSGKKWKIGYSSRIQSSGRVRFTLAHELGHYILHRELRDRFRCSTKEMHEWDELEIETEANVFASFLLMPLDDFRSQVAAHRPSIDMLKHCSDRYGVSLMAVALKWTEIAAKRAVVVAMRDGFVLWARSNAAAYKSGVYLASRKQTIAVPQTSILHKANAANGILSANLPATLWFPKESRHVDLIEHAVAVEGDYPYVLGLLLLPDSIPRWELEEDELLAPVHKAFRQRG